MPTGQQPTWEKRANHTTSGMRAVGGKLMVVGDSLVFRPHAVDEVFAANELAIRLADVESFEVEGRNLGQVLGGGLRKRLAVVTRDGRRELFVLNGVEKTVDELRRIASHS